MAVKTKKRKATKKKDGEQGLWSIITGWSLFAFGFLLLLSAMTVRYSGGAENWLGPYLGLLFPESMTFIFGRVAVLIFAIAAIVWGLWFILNMKHFRLFRLAGGILALSLTTSFLLSLRVYEVLHPSKTILFDNGGLVGSFLAQDIARPVFGNSPLAPALIGFFMLLVIAVFAFGLRLHHFSFLKVFFDKMLASWKTFQEKRRAKQESKEALEAEAEKEKGLLLDDFTIVKTGKAKPFKSTDSWCDSFVKSANTETLVDTHTDATATPVEDQEDEIAEKERFLLENEDRLGVREKRMLRDEIAELRRIQEQNIWEDKRRERPAIEALSVVKWIFKQKKTIPMQVNEEETIVPTAVESEIELEVINEEEPSSPAAEELTVYDVYKLPIVSDILPPSPDQPADYSEEELQQTAEMLEFQLENFKVKGKVVGISTGRLVTRFEVEPVRKSFSFLCITEDLALALKAMSIRILAPILKICGGIEIPNRKMHTVYSRYLESPLLLQSQTKFWCAWQRYNGKPAWICRSPHILIAGQRVLEISLYQRFDI